MGNEGKLDVVMMLIGVGLEIMNVWNEEKNRKVEENNESVNEMC